MKHFFIFLLFLGVQAQAQVPTFQQIIETGADVDILHAAPTPDGGLIAVGSSAPFGGFVGNYLVRVDPQGVVKWSHSQATFTSIWLQHVGVTSTGAFLIAGNLSLNGFPAGGIAKVNAAGAVDWYKSLESESNGMLAVEHADGYVFSGTKMGSRLYGSYLIKTDTTGRLLWSHLYELPGAIISFNAIRPTRDGGLLLVGAAGTGSAADVMLLKTDDSGNVSWIKRYDTEYGEADEARGCLELADSSFIITGYATSGNYSGARPFLMKTDASGNLRWSHEYALTSVDIPASVSACKEGGYILSGTTAWSVLDSKSNGFLVKTDSGGAVQWTKLIGSTRGDELVSADQTPDGGYILGGMTNSFGTGTRAAYVVKTDTAGNAGCYSRDTAARTKTIGMYPIPVAIPSDPGSGLLSPYTVGTSVVGSRRTLCSTVGVDPELLRREISLAPNPARSQVRVTVPGLQIASVSITDVSGSVVYRSSGLSGERILIDVSRLQSGIYFCSVFTADGRTRRAKLLVAH